MPTSRLNALDQALDIAGSLNQNDGMFQAEEVSQFGAHVVGQAGSTAAVTTINPSDVTITGLTGMTLQDVGNFINFSGANSSGNNGTFLIDGYISDTSVTIVNPNAVAPDSNNGSITWVEHYPYTLLDDLNYERTDRTSIKGVAYYQPVPTYQRPTAVGTNVNVNLANIANKTTDAVAYNVNRAFFGVSVAPIDTMVTITSVGNLKHADATDETGVPCFDAAPFTGDWTSCYVHVVDGYSTGSELVVHSGPHAGERIFGVTYNGASTSPNSVEVHFYSAPFNVNYAGSATPYTWDGYQPTTINLLYGYNERLDTLDQNAFRTVPALGILTDASLINDINTIFDQLGTTDGYQNLSTFLTNTSTYFPFFNLPNATPTVIDALNTLNSQIGDRTYTGVVLTSGQTITASLQALANAISNSTVTRTIERLAANITANTAHTLPGGITYTIDGTNNGQYLFLFTRGLLRDPGPVSGNNDYAETSTTQVTFYATQKAGDHINYLIK